MKSGFHIKMMSVACAIFMSACGQNTADVQNPAKVVKSVTVQTPPATPSQPAPVVNQAQTVQPVLSGQKLYKRCSACHLPTGKGVVGAFPPLTGHVSTLLNSELGKEYLTLVTYYGLSGTIEVSGQSYSSIMPAQGGMKPDRAAATLNYIMQEFNGVAEDDPRLFTADFVAATTAKYGRLSGAKVHALRAAAYASVQSKSVQPKSVQP